MLMYATEYLGNGVFVFYKQQLNQQQQQPTKEKVNNMYRLFIEANGQRQYVVNEKRDGNTYSFRLTTSQADARQFKGGGRFSASPVAQFFKKEEVLTEKFAVVSNGTEVARYSNKPEAYASLGHYASLGYGCLSVKSVF